MDETSGSRADSKGSNNLTDNNTVTYAPGRLANAGQFASANNKYLSSVDNSDLSTGDIDFTLAAWVNLDTTDYNPIVTKATSGTNREYRLTYNILSNSRFTFEINNSSGTQVGIVHANNFGAPSTGNWYYVLAWHGFCCKHG